MTTVEQKIRENLVSHLNHAPFEAFVIHFTDGAKFDVVRPFQAGVGLSRGLVASADHKVRRNFHVRDIRSINSAVVA